MNNLTLQFSNLAMDPRNYRQPLPPPPSLYFFTMQQPPANTIPGFYGLPFFVGPVFQGMDQQNQYQHRAQSWGPSCYQRSNGFRKAEAQSLSNIIHASSGAIARDRYTGIHPGYARIRANDNTGAEKRMRTKPYNRDRSSRTRRRRTDNVDPSVYKIPLAKSRRRAMAGRQNIPTPVRTMPSSTWTASSSYMEITKNSNAQRQPVEEEDCDTISLGSDTEY